MAEVSYQEAVQTLRRHLGARWDGPIDNGRGEMARILTSELGYSDKAAKDAIEAMIHTGQLRYYASERGQGDADAELTVPAGTVLDPVGGSHAGTGGSTEAPNTIMPGHWQIGGDEPETPGRAGQVHVV